MVQHEHPSQFPLLTRWPTPWTYSKRGSVPKRPWLHRPTLLKSLESPVGRHLSAIKELEHQYADPVRQSTFLGQHLRHEPSGTVLTEGTNQHPRILRCLDEIQVLSAALGQIELFSIAIAALGMDAPARSAEERLLKKNLQLRGPSK